MKAHSRRPFNGIHIEFAQSPCYHNKLILGRIGGSYIGEDFFALGVRDRFFLEGGFSGDD